MCKIARWMFVCLMSFLIPCAAQDREGSQLFQIVEEGKIGFIDSAGHVVIPPKFRGAGDFSEGLASARVNGTYGFINKSGSFVIAPQYDYATYFSEGLAVVYKNGVPYYIDKKGNKPFDGNYLALTPFENGRGGVKTVTGRKGFIDKKGKLVIDTIFSEIDYFAEGIAVASKVSRGPDNRNRTEVGIIDTMGNSVIPFGKYAFIGKIPHNDYYQINIAAHALGEPRGGRKYRFLDKHARPLFSENTPAIPWRQKNATNNGFSMHYLDTAMEFVIGSTSFYDCRDFLINRAFAQDWSGNYWLVNNRGKVLSDIAFSEVGHEGFKYGFADVAINGKWGIIDTNAHFVVKPTYDRIYSFGLDEEDDCFFYKQGVVNQLHNAQWGIARKDGSIQIQPSIDGFEYYERRAGLIKCIIAVKSAYVNKKGKIIWQEKNCDRIDSLNTDKMTEGYFPIHGKLNKSNNTSINTEIKIEKQDRILGDSLQVIVHTEANDTFKGDYYLKGQYYAQKIIVANPSGKDVVFMTGPGGLNIIVQALDANGEWKDIQYPAYSTCGNAYDKVTLTSGHYLQLKTPTFTGEFKTNLRVKLFYLINGKSGRPDFWHDIKENIIYSNEYPGSVNPGQFWRKDGYRQNELMTPYQHEQN